MLVDTSRSTLQARRTADVTRDVMNELVARLLVGLPDGVHGAAVAIPAAGSLHPVERALMADMGSVRGSHFAGGRTCARIALAQLGVSGPVTCRTDGAPVWPPGVRGSISHKDDLAIAIVGSDESVSGLGIDLEVAQPLPIPARRGALTPGERARVAAAPGDAGVRAQLAFSAKESYYKWLRSSGRDDPVGFQHVEVDVEPTAGLHVGILRYLPVAGVDLPVPCGLFTWGSDWLVTVAWSGRR